MRIAEPLTNATRFERVIFSIHFYLGCPRFRYGKSIVVHSRRTLLRRNICHVGVYTYYGLVGAFTTGDPGWVLNAGNQIAIDHQSYASPVGLRDGDQVVSLSGIEYKNYFTYDRFFYHSSPRDTFTILVKRDGKFLEFTLRTAPPPLSQRVIV